MFAPLNDCPTRRCGPNGIVPALFQGEQRLAVPLGVAEIDPGCEWYWSTRRHVDEWRAEHVEEDEGWWEDIGRSRGFGAVDGPGLGVKIELACPVKL